MASAKENILINQNDKRYIYSGHADKVNYEDLNETNTNRPIHKRKHSTFNIVSWMFGFAVVALLYIGNVIAVERLVKEVEELKIDLQKNANINQLLEAEINRKTSVEQISLKAENLLSMKNPSTSPKWFSIDNNLLERMR